MKSQQPLTEPLLRIRPSRPAPALAEQRTAEMAPATGLTHDATRERHRPGPGTNIGPDGTPSPGADAVLTTLVRELGPRSDAMAGHIVQLAIVGCDLIAVAQRTPHQTGAVLRTAFDAVRDRRTEGRPRR